jgi:hypothetical protein
MSRKAKQFGIAKNSKRRQKRKRREHAIDPAAIVPRSQASVVYQLFLDRAQQPVRIAPSLRHLVS